MLGGTIEGEILRRKVKQVKIRKIRRNKDKKKSVAGGRLMSMVQFVRPLAKKGKEGEGGDRKKSSLSQNQKRGAI